MADNSLYVAAGPTLQALGIKSSAPTSVSKVVPNEYSTALLVLKRCAERTPRHKCLGRRTAAFEEKRGLGEIGGVSNFEVWLVVRQ